jgi:hypothetical protein
VLFALDEVGNRHLLVPLIDPTQAVADRRSAGVHLRSFALEEDGSQRAFLDVACRKRHLNEVFGLLAAEMLEALAKDCRDAGRVCKSVLLRWRELLDREQSQVLPLDALVGLYAELSVLRELIRRDVRTLVTWTGPLGTPFDFTSGALAIEAKGILGTTWDVVIHGLEQLDVPAGTSLWLSVLQLQRGEPDGESVPDVVDDLISIGADKPVLVARLARIGYAVDDRESYSEIRFRRLASRTWSVGEDFPRVTRASFRPGAPPRALKALTYVLDLGTVDQSPLDVDEVAVLHDRLAATVLP